jgi:hypothetical protein
MSQHEQYSLSAQQFGLLKRLVNSKRKQSNKIFDKQDYCFIPRSLRDLERVSGESKSSLQRLFASMESKGLLQKVRNESNLEVWMLNPSFLGRAGSTYNEWFMKAMYHLRSYNKACEWSQYCRKHGVLYNYNHFSTTEVIDLSTGEVTFPNNEKLRNLTAYELYLWEQYRESYSSTDRTKKRTNTVA